MEVTAQEIIDAALLLEPGDRIVTRCSSYQEMEVLRSHLYKTRARLLKAHKTLAYPLYISREIQGDSWLVIVTKEAVVSNIVVISKDGTVKPFKRVVPVVTGAIGEMAETGVVRMVELMKADGMSPEEIEEALAAKGEEDFDAAATKVEEMQGVTAKDEDVKDAPPPKKVEERKGGDTSG